MDDAYDDFEEFADDEPVDFDFSSNEKVEEWVRVWMNEKASPEILPFRADLVDDLIIRLSAQKQRSKGLGVIENMIVSMEYERFAFMLRDYLKMRMMKLHHIGDYALAQKNDPDIDDSELIVNRLSAAELSFIKDHKALRDEHFETQLLNYLTARMRTVDKGKTVTKPQLNKFVCIKVIEHIGQMQLGTQSFGESQGETGNIIDFSKGSSHIVRYSLIRDFIKSNKMELI